MLVWFQSLIATMALIMVIADHNNVLAAESKYAISSESLRALPANPTMKIEFDGISSPPENMRAIFHEEVERRNVLIDPVSETVMVVRWDGPFHENDNSARLQLEGRGGARSRTELGLVITLGTPFVAEGELTYSLGVAIEDSVGIIWKGKVIMVTASQRKSDILRQMSRRLAEYIGLAVQAVEDSTSARK